MSKFDLSLRSSRSSYFATFRHQLTILSKTDALDEGKWLNRPGTFVKGWFRYHSHFVHVKQSIVQVLKEKGLLAASEAIAEPLVEHLRAVAFSELPERLTVTRLLGDRSFGVGLGQE